MKKLRLVPVLLICICTKLFSQGGGLNDQFDNSVNPGGDIKEIASKPPTVTGSYYMYDEWQPASISFESGKSYDNLLVKYDLKNQLVEVKTEEEIKIAPVKSIGSMTYAISGLRLQNTSSFKKYDGYNEIGRPEGLLGVASSNNEQLKCLVKYSIDVRESSYNAALHVGENKVKISTEEDLLLLVKNNLAEMPGSRKKFLELLAEHGYAQKELDQLEAFIKKQKIKLIDPEEVQLALDFLTDSK